MQILKERILKDGKCFPGGILKVDSFINHQMDPVLMEVMAELESLPNPEEIKISKHDRLKGKREKR